MAMTPISVAMMPKAMVVMVWVAVESIGGVIFVGSLGGSPSRSGTKVRT